MHASPVTGVHTESVTRSGRSETPQSPPAVTHTDETPYHSADHMHFLDRGNRLGEDVLHENEATKSL